MQRTPALVVVLGTGGTIAGTAASTADDSAYTAAQLGVGHLVQAVPALGGTPLECEQVAQIDSKDMEHAVWQLLVERVAHHLARPEVAGLVITHGTDTLEETAYLLQRVLAPTKPVVLTAAMRPATSAEADGPQNLLDAVTLARHEGAQGVVAVLAGKVHGALGLRKAHTCRIDAFDSRDAEPLGRISAGQVQMEGPWPQGDGLGIDWPARGQLWPKVVIVTSHAGVDGTLVDAALALGVQGIVVAGTGNGTVHHALEAALLRAQHAGVQVMRCSCVPNGPVLSKPGERFPAGGGLPPVKARIELMLALMRAD